MTLGLSGAHRTGKSTLAKAFSEKSGIPFVPTTATEVFKRLGVDPKADLPFGERLKIQWEILNEFSTLWSEHTDFITDRTPIDMLAYTLADVRRGNLSSSDDEQLKAYSKECFALTNRFFSTIVVVQPGIEAKDAEGKAPASYGYTDHINRLIIGLVVSEDIACHHFFIPRKTLDLSKRVSCVEYSVVRVVERHRSLVDSAGDAFVLH